MLPGTGKTVLACATATAVGARFFVINGPEVRQLAVGSYLPGYRAHRLLFPHGHSATVLAATFLDAAYVQAACLPCFSEP